MASGGFITNPDDLRGASSHIRDAIQMMGESTLGGLSGDSDIFGHEGLAGTFSTFCSAAQGALETMRRDTEYHGSALVDAASAYAGTDAAGQDLMRGFWPGGDR